jgi:hypothetical protein
MQAWQAGEVRATCKCCDCFCMQCRPSACRTAQGGIDVWHAQLAREAARTSCRCLKPEALKRLCRSSAARDVLYSVLTQLERCHAPVRTKMPLPMMAAVLIMVREPRPNTCSTLYMELQQHNVVSSSAVPAGQSSTGGVPCISNQT